MISVLFPTTGRPHRAAKCLRELVATTDGHDLEIVAVVDDCPETHRALLALTFPARVCFRLTYSPQRRGCSAAWNEALARSTGDPLVFAADDLVWGEGWLDEALRVMNEAFDEKGGLVGFNDGHMDGRELSTHYLMSRAFVIDVLGGVVAWDHYRHSFNDLEVNRRAKHADRFAWAEKSRVTHEHWLFGDREQDDTDRLALEGWQESHDVFHARQAAGFPTDYEPVIT